MPKDYCGFREVWPGTAEDICAAPQEVLRACGHSAPSQPGLVSSVRNASTAANSTSGSVSTRGHGLSKVVQRLKVRLSE